MSHPRTRTFFQQKLIAFPREQPVVLQKGNVGSEQELTALSEKLKADGTTMRGIMENAPDILSSVDLEGRFLYANHSHEIATGHTKVDLEGRYLYEFLYPEDQERFKTLFQGSVRSRRPGNIDVRMLCKSGDYLWFNVSWNFHLDEQQRILRIGIFSNDINEEKKAEEELKCKMTISMDIIRFSHYMICHVTPEGNIDFANPDMLRNFKNKNDIIGKHFLDFVAPSHKKTVAVFIEDHMRNRKPSSHLTFPVQLTDGREIWLELDVQTIIKNGEITGYQAISRDITKKVLGKEEKRRNEEALQKAQEVLMETVNKIVEGVVIHDRGKIILVNDPFATMVGRPREELLYTNGLDYLTPGSRKICEDYVEGKAPALTPELELLHKDGHIVPVKPQTTRLDSSDLRVWTLLDLTKRKEVERLLQQKALYDHLSGLANRELLEANYAQALGTANRHKTDVLPYTITIIYIDINKFKDINDVFGHKLGDEKIKETAEILRNRIRPLDTACRCGGDEFVLLLENITTDSAKERIEKIIADGETKELSFSIGYYTIDLTKRIIPSTATAIRELLEEHIDKADKAMYLAKDIGETQPPVAVKYNEKGRSVPIMKSNYKYYDDSNLHHQNTLFKLLKLKLILKRSIRDILALLKN
jgi:diguanylate cyclase (GGDEF)-like protein/PAS domain S-box-containing protein